MTDLTMKSSPLEAAGQCTTSDALPPMTTATTATSSSTPAEVSPSGQASPNDTAGVVDALPPVALPLFPLVKHLASKTLAALCRRGLALCGETSEDPASAASPMTRFFGLPPDGGHPGYWARPDVKAQLTSGEQSQEVTNEVVREAIASERHWSSTEAQAHPFPQARPVLCDAGRAPLWLTDNMGEGILLPLDPLLVLERHQTTLDRLRIAIGNQPVFDRHVMSFLWAWAGAVQGLPAGPTGLWREEGGLFEASLSVAIAALSVLDGRVIEHQLPAMDRDAYVQRLRVALTIAAAIGEANSLVRVKLLSFNARGNNTGCFLPGLQSAYEFGLAHSGESFQLTWKTPQEASRLLTTLPLDLLYMTLSPGLRAWLMGGILPGGETPLAILEHIAQYQVGQTSAESIFAEVLTEGQALAYDREARRRAALEGTMPVHWGFVRVANAAIRFAILRGLWPLNAKGSPLLKASDGYYLRWPEAFSSLLQIPDFQAVLKCAPDEPYLAERLLQQAEIFMPNGMGGATMEVRATHPDLAGVTVVQLTKERDIHQLVLKAIGNGNLPPTLQAFHDVTEGPSPTRYVKPGGRHRPIFYWDVRQGIKVSNLVLALLEQLNRTTHREIWMTPAGVFVPASLFPDVDERLLQTIPEYLLCQRLAPNPAAFLYGMPAEKERVRTERISPILNVRVPEAEVKKFATYFGESAEAPSLSWVLGEASCPTITGVIIRRQYLCYQRRYEWGDKIIDFPTPMLHEVYTYTGVRTLHENMLVI